MKILGADIETTGLEQSDGHRIIEFTGIQYEFDVASKTLRELRRLCLRIDPERAIDAKAQKVHGISYADLVGSPKWPDVAGQVSDLLADSDLLVAHNLAFDAPFISGELSRIGVAVPRLKGYCTMENGNWATFHGKNPRLEELCFALGVEYDQSKAHSATYDVEVMMACLSLGVQRGFFQLPGVSIS